MPTSSLAFAAAANSRNFISAARYGFNTAASAAANKTAIDNALAAAKTSGKNVLMPPGIFSINGFTPPGTNPIATDYPSQTITLKGAGNGYAVGGSSTPGVATVLKFAAGVASGLGAAATYGIYIDNAKHWMNFEDFLIDGNAAIDYGMRITSQMAVQRVTAIRCNLYGFRGQTLDSTHMTDLVAVNNIGGGMLLDQALATESTNVTPNTVSYIVGGVFQGNGGIGLEVQQLQHGKFLGCVIQSNTSFGLKSRNAAATSGMQHCDFDGCWFENNGGGGNLYQILIDSANALDAELPYGNTFRNCRIDPLVANKSIHIVKGWRNRFINNVHTNNGTGAVDLDAGAKDTVFHDCIHSDGTAISARITDLGTRNYEYGKFKTPTFNAANFTAGGAQTWTVDAGDVIVYDYCVVEKLMTLVFSLNTTSVGGVPDVDLRIAIPGGFVAVGSTLGTFIYSNNAGADTVGTLGTADGQAYITLKLGIALLATKGTWAAAANTTYVYGRFTFEVR